MQTAQTHQQNCPQCGAATFLLHPIDGGMLLRLKSDVGMDVNFTSVCSTCFKTLSKSISHGTLLQAEKQIQSHFRNNLWKTRLNLIRQARTLMSRQQYAEAATCYEKYLKILEYVYDKKRSEITPGLFKERPREVTIIAIALWDLMSIYDLNAQYWPRQEAAAIQLGQMIGYTNLYSTIVKAAGPKRRFAKNPHAYKLLMSSANVKYSGCFIATVAYPNRTHPTIRELCAFRDQVLKNHFLGRCFIYVYYRWSPGLANHLQHYALVRKILRIALPPIATCLKRLFNLNVSPNL